MNNVAGSVPFRYVERNGKLTAVNNLQLKRMNHGIKNY